jgi:hypothetical protein
MKIEKLSGEFIRGYTKAIQIFPKCLTMLTMI